MSDARQHPHTVYLIRHGETVDNVAGVYAGITDSALTIHGVLQGEKLGQYFARQDVVFTHFYSSDLSRANKTAENIRKYQATGDDAPAVVVCPDLREQDFGFYEKKAFYARSPDSKKTGKDLHRAEHQNEEGFKDVETKESMAKRADSYLDEHLMAVLKNAPPDHQYVICIVSHGIMLSSLWKAILRRQRANTVTLDNEVLVAGKPLALEHLGGFSNTGYLHLEFRRVEAGTVVAPSSAETHLARADEQPDAQSNSTCKPLNPTDVLTKDASPDVQTVLSEAETALATKDNGPAQSTPVREHIDFNIIVKMINGKDHVKGLKRTGGGVGRSKFDEGQKSIDNFFKKRRTEP